MLDYYHTWKANKHLRPKWWNGTSASEQDQVFPFFFFKSKGLEICFPLVILKVNFSPITDLSPITSSTVSHTASVKLLLRCHLVFCVINILPKLPGFAPPTPHPQLLQNYSEGCGAGRKVESLEMFIPPQPYLWVCFPQVQLHLAIHTQ